MPRSNELASTLRGVAESMKGEVAGSWAMYFGDDRRSKHESVVLPDGNDEPRVMFALNAFSNGLGFLTFCSEGGMLLDEDNMRVATGSTTSSAVLTPSRIDELVADLLDLKFVLETQARKGQEV